MALFFSCPATTIITITLKKEFYTFATGSLITIIGIHMKNRLLMSTIKVVVVFYVILKKVGIGLYFNFNTHLIYNND